MYCFRPLLLAALSAAPVFAQAKAPNFLFIAIDDLKPILGHFSEEPNSFLSEIYPDPAKRAAIRKVISPHMDRLPDPALKTVREAMNAQLDQRIQAGPFPYDTGTPGRSTAGDEEGAGRKRAAGKKRS